VLSGGGASSAQSSAKPPVIGLLDAGQRMEWWEAFRQQLRDLGHVEGRNVSFEPRYAAGNTERLSALARELGQLKVRVIVTGGSIATRAAIDATAGIPIVMATGDDPVTTGIVTSLARPGGRVTGVTSISDDLDAKRLELLREVMPKLSRLALIWHAENPVSARRAGAVEPVAQSLKLELRRFGIKSADELPPAFAAMAQERAGAVFVIAGPQLFPDRERLAGLALKHRLPSMHTQSEYVDAGGFISYGPSYPDLFRRAAVYVDKILKGAKPGELPIEQPTQVSLLVNLKTAQALGVIVTRSLLLRAERVIE
jgi:putative tryptophan/tyrosine transport system substrate-binding protein